MVAPRSKRGAADLIVEFCVVGVPTSAQTKNRMRLRQWQELVASKAMLARKRSSPIEDAIDIRISEFSEGRRRDRDNVAKPIQDAMQGVLFVNDRQVLRLESEWCDIDGRYRVRFIPPVLAQMLSTGDEFVWIRVFRHRQREDLSP